MPSQASLTADSGAVLSETSTTSQLSPLSCVFKVVDAIIPKILDGEVSREEFCAAFCCKAKLLSGEGCREQKIDQILAARMDRKLVLEKEEAARREILKNEEKKKKDAEKAQKIEEIRDLKQKLGSLVTQLDDDSE